MQHRCKTERERARADVSYNTHALQWNISRDIYINLFIAEKKRGVNRAPKISGLSSGEKKKLAPVVPLNKTRGARFAVC